MSMSSTEKFSPPTTQKAIVADDEGRPVVELEAQCPPFRPEAGQVYVHTEAVAINPSDTKMKGDFVSRGALFGADYAGKVVAVGAGVENVQVGDCIGGAQYSMHAEMPDHGAFGEYNVTNGSVWCKIPPSMSVEAGASLGAGISTAGMAIRALGLPLPSLSPPQSAPSTFVLVYGGSTATGTLAIQLLKLANLVPITTCSPHNFDLVKSRGAKAVFDYRDPECGANIKKFTSNNLRYALDCITTVESMQICYSAVGRAGGRYVSLDPYSEHLASTRKVVKPEWVLGPAIFGQGCTWPAPYGRAPDEELRKFGIELWTLAQELLSQGKLEPHPLKILHGGLDAVVEGMDLVEKGDLSGEKVVVML